MIVSPDDQNTLTLFQKGFVITAPASHWAMLPHGLLIRIVRPTDFSAVKDLRLRALDTDSGNLTSKVFGRSLIEASDFSNERWIKLSTETTDQFILGGFFIDQMGHERSLVAMSAVIPCQNDDPDIPESIRDEITGKRTAIFTSSYIDKQFRGLRIFPRINEARIEYAFRKGYEIALMYVRDGNKRSADTHEKAGALEVATSDIEWGDGKVHPAHWRLLYLDRLIRTMLLKNTPRILAP